MTTRIKYGLFYFGHNRFKNQDDIKRGTIEFYKSLMLYKFRSSNTSKRIDNIVSMRYNMIRKKITTIRGNL